MDIPVRAVLELDLAKQLARQLREAADLLDPPENTAVTEAAVKLDATIRRMRP